MKKQFTRYNVIYSYFDEKEGKRLQSQDGVIIAGYVTPAKLKIAVYERWNKIGYFGNLETLEVVSKESIRG